MHVANTPSTLGQGFNITLTVLPSPGSARKGISVALVMPGEATALRSTTIWSHRPHIEFSTS